MGVIDLDARVKKLEQGGGGIDPTVIDQLEAAVIDLEETVNGDGETDLGLVGDVAALQDSLEALSEYSGTETKIGTWVDGKDLYAKTYVFTSTDLDDATIDTTVIQGGMNLDIEAYDTIFVDFGASFMFDSNQTTNGVKVQPLNYSAPDSSNSYTRTNLQLRSTVNDGKPYVYFKNTYSSGSWYDDIAHVKWFLVVKYTKPSEA